MAASKRSNAGVRANGKPTRALAAALTTPIATTADGRDVTRPYVYGLHQPRDPRLLRSVDWGVYDRILEDDQVFSTLQQRRGAVVSRDWNVVPGDEADPRSVAAADALRANLIRIGWDRVTDKMLYAAFYGYSVAELMWRPRGGHWEFGGIHVRHARRFRYNDDCELRLLVPGNTIHGEELPERKFWVVSAGASDDDEPYGRGLAEWLYWPTLFKRNGVRFWNNFTDRYSTPTAVGKYRPGTPVDQIDRLLAALQAFATDSGIAIPDGMAIELMHVSQSGSITNFETLCRYMDAAITKVVLSQTMTTDNGASLSQAQVHAGVKLEVVKSDADLLSDSFNEGPARWFTEFNFGAEVEPPRVMRDIEEEIDTKYQAETDEILARVGWMRSEESFRDTYGDGYERTQPVNNGPSAPALQRPRLADETGDAGQASFAAGASRLSQLLNNRLNALADGDEERRSALIGQMADAAGIERGTVLQILRGEIDTPPEQRIRGFAKVLNLPVDRIEKVVERGNAEQDSRNEVAFVESEPDPDPTETEALLEGLIKADGHRIAGEHSSSLIERIAAAADEEELMAILQDARGHNNSPLYEALHRASFAFRIDAANEDAGQ